MSKFTLKSKFPKGSHVVTAYAESAAGPGWANHPIWVIIRLQSGKLEEVCIQPEEQTAEMMYLYSVSAAAHGSMVSAVNRERYRKKDGK